MKNEFNLAIKKINKSLLIHAYTRLFNCFKSYQVKIYDAAPKCSVKPLLKASAAALKIIHKQIKNYNYRNQ